MVKHKDLTGNELHPAKVGLESPDRVPAFPGEVLFDGSQTWIANGSTQEDWARSTAPPPVVFSWLINSANYTPPNNSSLTKLELYYLDCTALTANSNADSFNLLTAWEIGTDLGVGCPVLLSGWIAKKGKGCYVLLLNGPDAYGNSLSPIENSRLHLLGEATHPALTIFRFETEFLAADAETHSRPYGFEVITPLAQIEIQLGNEA
jgi:hypothetical protein